MKGGASWAVGTPFYGTLTGSFETGTVMAESEKNVMERSVADLEKEITCAICREIYVEPKVLPCCHYYCKKCVYNIALRTGLDQLFSCPECRADTKLPHDSVDSLPTAFFIRRIQDLHTKLKQAQNVKALAGARRGTCEMCMAGSHATAYCQQCSQLICERCTESHQRMKIFAEHVITLLDNTSNAVVQESALVPCKEHKQSMSLYCFDCSGFICRDCTIKDHFSHNHEFIGKAASQARENLDLDLKPLHSLVTEICNATEEIHTAKAQVQSHNTSVIGEVENSFNQLHAIIEEYKGNLLNEVSENFCQKMENLALQEETISKSLEAITRVKEYTEQCVQHLSDSEVIQMRTEVHDMIYRTIERHSNVMNLDPVEETNTEVELCNPQDVKQFLLKAKLIVLPVDPSKCVVSGTGVKSAEVGKPATFSLTTKLSNGKCTMQTSTVSCFLKSTNKGAVVVRCNVNRPKHGEYVIQYTPTVRGQNQLTVKVNGQEIADSPFFVCAYTPCTELDQPVMVITDRQLSTPYDVTVNSRGEIIVAEWNGNVVSFDKEGKKLKSIQKADHKFGHLTGVAVDTNDNIYVTEKSNLIFKFDDKMKLVKKIKHHSSSNNLYGVTVGAENEVMVCEKEKNFITVYNTDLEYSRQIESPSMSTAGQGILDIAADGHGSIYTSHYGSSHIQVLNNAGELLKTFGFPKGSNPCGISVTGRYVHVTDEANHKVFVYSTEGEFMTSFGQWGSAKGHFYGPCGLYVRDSYVYVCDRYNNRVQIF